MSDPQTALENVHNALQALKDGGYHFRASAEAMERLKMTQMTGAKRAVTMVAEPRPAPSVRPPASAAASFEQLQAGISAPAPARTAATAGGGSSKAERLAALRGPVLACSKCPQLVSSRKQVVFGVGNPEAELMFVGEAPGADEDLVGEPFVGKAGQLLTKIIETMGIRRNEVYIANILKCRPNMPPGESGNRKPTIEEMNVCQPYLMEQIKIIEPRVIVALGATAVEGLLGDPLPITKVRGQWKSFLGTPLMLTFHPAYLLRNQSLSEKRKVWEDMLQVLEKLGRPISEKQRNYFL